MVTKEDDETLSSALGGTTRLVPRKPGSNQNSYCGNSETESMPPSSPRDTDSPNFTRFGSSPPPQHPTNGPTTSLANALSPVDGPTPDWQWGRAPQNMYYQYPGYSTNPQWPAAVDTANWYDSRFHNPTPAPLSAHPHYQQQQQYVDVTMEDTSPSFGQTSSVLGGTVSSYNYGPQQVPPPQINGHAHWDNLFVEMGASYP